MGKLWVAALPLLFVSGSAIAAPEISAQIALRKYCEPLIAGGSAHQTQASALADGMHEEVIGGQRVLRAGQLVVMVSDSPRVCAVQAPSTMTFVQGLALADNWGRSKRGAVKSPATKGPDGAPVRGWTAWGSKMALVGSYQLPADGRHVWTFILMPTAALIRAKR